MTNDEAETMSIRTVQQEAENAVRRSDGNEGLWSTSYCFISQASAQLFHGMLLIIFGIVYRERNAVPRGDSSLLVACSSIPIRYR